MILRSRSWVAEEGEIFRKGNKLLGPEEMEGEYAGEELRIEVRTSRLNGSKQITQAAKVTGGAGRTTSSACYHG